MIPESPNKSINTINVCLLLIELKLNTKQDSAQERTNLFLFIKCINKIYRKKTVNLHMGKIIKAIEETKWIVAIKRLLLEFGLYCNFMITDDNMIGTQRTPSPSNPVSVFLIAEKLVNL